MNWFQVIVTVCSALAGGFVGGWVVAFRMGRWQQSVEDRLSCAERRLAEGGPHVDAVPIIEARLDVVLQEIREVKRELREERKYYVSHEECDRRHGDGDER